MIDFRELDKNGILFEILIREIFIKLDYEVKWAGVGPDRGKDLLVTEKHDSFIGDTKTKWLVQCKHNAHSGKAVGLEDLGDFVSACHDHDVTHYLLICSTQPSSSLLERFENISINKKIIIDYWDATKVEKLLDSVKFYDLFQLFFPKSSKASEIKVFATINPNEWIFIHRGYYIILENRIMSSSLEWSHNTVKETVLKINMFEKAHFSQHEMLMPRKVWFNGKSPEFVWHIDYLYDSYPMKNRALSKTVDEIKYFLEDGFVDENGQIHFFDIQVVPSSFGSDHFHENHYDYYDVVSRIRGQEFTFRKKIYEKDFERLRSNINTNLKDISSVLSEASSIKVLNIIKDRTEEIFNFRLNMSWEELFKYEEVDSSSEFFGPKMIISSPNEEELLSAFSDLFSIEGDGHFDLVKRYVYGNKIEKDDYTYDLKFKVMFAKNYLDYLVKLDTYLDQLKSILIKNKA